MNVIVVVCNSLHLGFLGAYGNAWIETPNLDRLAAEGVVFDHHFPENLTTLPTRRSWWTGRYGFRRPGAGLDAAAARRADPARHALGPGGQNRPDLRRTPAPRGRHGLRPGVRRGRSGFADKDTTRLSPPADPRPGKVRLEDEPGLRLPPRTTPITTSGRIAGSSSSEIGRCSGPTSRKTRAWRGPSGGDRLARPAGDRVAIRSCSGSICSARTGLGTRLSPIATSTPTVEPDEFEAGEEGDLVEESDGEEDEIDIEEVAVLIDVPAGAVGDVLDEAELFRLRRTYAGTVTLVDRWLGELFEALRRMGRLDDTLLIFTSDQGEPLGEHGYRPPVPSLALRRADAYAAVHPIARRQARRQAASGAGADRGPLADHPRRTRR